MSVDDEIRSALQPVIVRLPNGDTRQAVPKVRAILEAADLTIGELRAENARLRGALRMTAAVMRHCENAGGLAMAAVAISLRADVFDAHEIDPACVAGEAL